MLEPVGIVYGQTRHQVKSAHRLLHHHPRDLAQSGDHRIPADAVLRLGLAEKFRIHGVQRCRANLVNGSHRQTGLAEFQDGVLELQVLGHHAAHPGTAGGEPLGYGINDDQIVIDVVEAGHGGHAELLVVAELPVDLIADQEQVVLLGDVRDHPHLLLVQHHAGGVSGVGNEDGTGVFGNQALDALPLGIAVALPGIGGQGPDHAAGGMDEGGVVGVIGLRDDDLGIGVQNAQAGQEQCLAAAGGDQHIPGLQLHPQALVVAPDGLNELGVAGGSIVGQGLMVKGPDGIVVGRRRSNVRLADVQVIDFLAPLLRGHRQGMKFSHRRGFTAIGIDGNLHLYPSVGYPPRL